MIIKKLTEEAFASNNYLVICEDTNEAVLIDAGWDNEKTIEKVKETQVNLKYIFYTHAHMDHICGDHALKEKFNLKAFMHIEDKFLVDMFKEQLGMFGMPDRENPVVDEFISEGQELEVGKLKFKVIHTPGHSPGSVCYLSEDALFSGDTLFANSVGRTDLPGGNFEQLRDSIVNQLFKLDNEIKVYPGHGPTTTIGNEKLNNPFFGRNSRI